MRAPAFLIGAAALLAGGAAQGQTAESQTLDYEVRQGNRLVATQTVTVELGRTASVSIGGAYSVRLRLDRASGEAGQPAFLVRSTLARADSTNGERMTAPDMTVLQGLPARAQLASNLSVGVTIR